MRLTLARLWSLGGVALLFSFAIYRLGRRGFDTALSGLAPLEWTILAGCVAIFLYSEGIRILQRKWVPQVIARARSLTGDENPLFHLLAPLFGMGLIGAARTVALRAWGTVLAIVAAVWFVSGFPEPWRGIVDLSVATALAWALLFVLGGIVSLLGERSRDSRV